MKNLWIVFVLTVAIPAFLSAQTPRDERMKWWREARFGMFIHWGVYAQWAGTYKGQEDKRMAANGS